MLSPCSTKFATTKIEKSKAIDLLQVVKNEILVDYIPDEQK